MSGNKKSCYMAFLIAMTLIMILCSCGQQDRGLEGAADTGPVPADRIFIDGGKAEGIASQLVDDQDGWTGEGGCYRIKDPQFGQGIFNLDFYGEEFYFHRIEFEPSNYNMKIFRGEEKLYENREISQFVCAQKGMWVLESAVDEDTGGLEHSLVLIDYDGQELLRQDIVKQVGNSAIGDMKADGEGRVFLLCGDQINVFSAKGEWLGTILLKGHGIKLVRGGDGQMYAAVAGSGGDGAGGASRAEEEAAAGGASGAEEEAAAGDASGEEEEPAAGGASGPDKGLTKVFLLDVEQKQAVYMAEYVDLNICDGTQDWLYILADDTGLFGVKDVRVDGEKDPPIALWSELGVFFEGLKDVVPLSEGRFLLTAPGVFLIMEPADPAVMKVRTVLTMACVNPSSSFTQMAADFNAESNEYMVRLVDYTQRGEYDTKAAIEKLNVDIIAGRYPDMFDFAQLPEKYYSDKGLLSDLYAYMDEDPEIDREDFIALDKLETDGKLYYAGNRFILETAAGLYSRFGSSRGWTLEEYLDIQEETGGKMMYNVTKESFLRSIVLRYAARNVDWEEGTCSFDTEEFIHILNSVNQIRESPQPENGNADDTPMRVQMLEGTRVAVLCAVGNIDMIAMLEMTVGERLSFIGRPTADGEGGTTLDFYNLMGICSRGNTDGAWGFMKYVLTKGAENKMMGLSSNRKVLEEQLTDAMRAYENDESQTPFDKEDAQVIYELIDQAAFYGKASQRVVDIVMEEAAPFLNGSKTAQETARVIQSRVSIYVAEGS